MWSVLFAPMITAALRASWQPAAGSSWESSFRTSSPPRSGATAAADEAGTVWLFGGYAEPDDKPRDVVNDLLRYDGTDWDQLQEPIKPKLGGLLRGRTNQPGSRLASASSIVGGEMLLFGGWDPQTAGTGGVILDDVWSLRLASQQWTKCATPMPRGPTSRHVAVNVGGVLIVHTFRCTDAVLVWDGESRSLREQPTTGPAPSSRGLHVGAAADDHTLVVFGGAAKDGGMVDDAFALDTRSWEWRRLATAGANRPSPRAGACAATLPGGGGIVVCCGAEADPQGLIPRADVWALQVGRGYEDGKWTLLLDDDAPFAPGPRNAATLSSLSDGPQGEGRLLLHGGWRPFASTYADSHVLTITA